METHFSFYQSTDQISSHHMSRSLIIGFKVDINEQQVLLPLTNHSECLLTFLIKTPSIDDRFLCSRISVIDRESRICSVTESVWHPVFRKTLWTELPSQCSIVRHAMSAECQVTIYTVRGVGSWSESS